MKDPYGLRFYDEKRTSEAPIRVTQVIWYLLGLIETLLLLRFFLKLFDANAGAGFTQFIYQLTNGLAGPFLQVFAPITAGEMVFELSTLLAMAIYWLLAWAIVRLVLMIRPVSEAQADQKLEQQDVQ